MMGPKSPRRYCQCQLCSILALIPWAKATPAMDVPGARDSCTTPRLYSTGYRRRGASMPEITERELLIKTPCPFHQYMDTYLEDISAKSPDGAERAVTARVGHRRNHRELLADAANANDHCHRCFACRCIAPATHVRVDQRGLVAPVRPRNAGRMAAQPPASYRLKLLVLSDNSASSSPLSALL